MEKAISKWHKGDITETQMKNSAWSLIYIHFSVLKNDFIGFFHYIASPIILVSDFKSKVYFLDYLRTLQFFRQIWQDEFN